MVGPVKVGEKMEVKKKGNQIIIKHTLKKNETYRILEGSKFQSLTILKKPQIVKGISNETEDNKGVIFLDYDNVDLRIVEEDFNFIQKKFRLTPGYLFKTKDNNYHVICLTKTLHSKVTQILNSTRCDENYKSMPLRNYHRSYVLRISNKNGSKKPKFIEIIGKRQNFDKEISNAHLNFINKMYKVPSLTYYNMDKYKLIRRHTYETSN